MNNDPPEFLFDAMHAPKIACGNYEASANPVKVKEQVTYPPASWDKRFARELLTTTITEKEAAQVWRLFHKYRVDEV